MGTPLYVYDAQAIGAQYRTLSSALSSIPHRIFYSVKANGNLAVLGVVRRLGAGADIVSGGELLRARRAGIPASEIIFSGVGKRRDELELALAEGVGQINVESFDELRLIAALAAERDTVARCGIRVNPDVTTSAHSYTQTGGKDVKFGAPLDEVVGMAQWASGAPSLALISLGAHIGSQICEAREYRVAAETLRQLVEKLRDLGIRTLENVDVGGGFGIRYMAETPLDPEEFAEAVRPLASATGLPLVIEPGRFLVGRAGVLVTRCLYRKRAGGKQFAIVDAGMNDLLRPSLYGAAHDMVVVERGEGAAEASSDAEPVDVVGPICESGDFLGLARPLPGARPGALLAILGAGAYGFSMSSTYNSRPRAAEVLVDGQQWAVVRERETVDDLFRGEYTLQHAANRWRPAAQEGTAPRVDA